MSKKPDLPTLVAYEKLQQAFDYFNVQFFSGQLPPCLLTFQRKGQAYGYFSNQRFLSAEDGTHTDEIALNPAYFGVTVNKDVLSTLVHEMVHCWQHHHGKPGRRGYHNQEWAQQMEGIGLIPSNTGYVGGKRTGEKMSHYIQKSEPFDQSCDRLLEQGFIIPWVDCQPAKHVSPKTLADAEKDGVDLDGIDVSTEPKAPAKISKLKYTCFGCDTNAWARPGLVNMHCTKCDKPFEVNDNKADDLAAQLQTMIAAPPVGSAEQTAA